MSYPFDIEWVERNQYGSKPLLECLDEELERFVEWGDDLRIYRCKLAQCSRLFVTKTNWKRHTRIEHISSLDNIKARVKSSFLLYSRMTSTVKAIVMSTTPDIEPSRSPFEDLPVEILNRSPIENLPAEILLSINDELPDSISRACFALTNKRLFRVLDRTASTALLPPAAISGN